MLNDHGNYGRTLYGYAGVGGQPQLKEPARCTPLIHHSYIKTHGLYRDQHGERLTPGRGRGGVPPHRSRPGGCNSDSLFGIPQSKSVRGSARCVRGSARWDKNAVQDLPYGGGILKQR